MQKYQSFNKNLFNKNFKLYKCNLLFGVIILVHDTFFKKRILTLLLLL